MLVQVNVSKKLGIYQDPTCWQNSTLRYVPPTDFPEFLESRLGKAKIMRTWITLDEYWDRFTDTYYPDFEIGLMRYPVEKLHYAYDMSVIVPAPTGTRFEDYLTSHSRHAEELMLNVRRYEREVSDGIITFEQYETVFEKAVEYCKELAPNIRYVECCNEVDIAAFGNLTAQEYVNIYLVAHKVITRLNAKHNYAIPLELGGFAQAHTLQTHQLMLDIMKLLKESPIGEDPMAFYSYHLYNAPENRSLYSSGMYDLMELSGVQKLQLMVKQHYDMIEHYGLPQRPVFLDELGRARATGIDGDSTHNAAGLLTYLIGFSQGLFGKAYPFPWCTFHNPNLQISFTQYIRREDGSYAATPNGIALEMLHSMHGQMVKAQVTNCHGTDPEQCAIAVENEEYLDVLCVNNSTESVGNFVEITGLPEGEYRVDRYLLDLFENNVVYKRGYGDGTMKVTSSRKIATDNGTIRIQQVLDKDNFVLFRIYK